MACLRCETNVLVLILKVKVVTKFTKFVTERTQKEVKSAPSLYFLKVHKHTPNLATKLYHTYLFQFKFHFLSSR